MKKETVRSLSQLKGKAPLFFPFVTNLDFDFFRVKKRETQNFDPIPLEKYRSRRICAEAESEFYEKFHNRKKLKINELRNYEKVIFRNRNRNQNGNVIEISTAYHESW